MFQWILHTPKWHTDTETQDEQSPLSFSCYIFFILKSYFFIYAKQPVEGNKPKILSLPFFLPRAARFSLKCLFSSERIQESLSKLKINIRFCEHWFIRNEQYSNIIPSFCFCACTFLSVYCGGSCLHPRLYLNISPRNLTRSCTVYFYLNTEKFL